MPTIQLNFMLPTAAQQSIIDSTARFKVVNCGRRFGKTKLLEDEIANPMLDDIGPYAYFVPTYKMLAEIWNDFKAMLHPITRKVNEQEKRLELITGSTLDGWSLDNPDGPRGRKYKKVAIDEAASIPKLQYAWENVILATLADYQGKAIFGSTPKGRNYFWQLYQLGNDPMYTDWQSFHFPTLSNPRIAPSEIELARTTVPQSVFEQEYEAMFLEGGGAVFRNLRACIQAPPDYAYGSTVMGVDWGRQNDYTVLVVMDSYTRAVLAIDRFNQIDWQLQRGRLTAMANRYKVNLILAEENSMGGPNIEELQREGQPIHPFTTTNASKTMIINALALAFEQQTIHIPNDPVLLSELEAFAMERLPSGVWRYSAPDGLHDDCVIALALANHAIASAPSIANASRVAPTRTQNDRRIRPYGR